MLTASVGGLFHLSAFGTNRTSSDVHSSVAFGWILLQKSFCTGVQKFCVLMMAPPSQELEPPANPERFSIAALVLSSGAALAAEKASAKFLPKAIEGNFAEVEMGKLAQSNGQSEDVKSFGKMLVTDHTAANEKAMDVAKSMNVTAPTGPNEKQKAAHDKMAKMKGAEFDKMFAKDT
jgi:hypothetical protein